MIRSTEAGTFLCVSVTFNWWDLQTVCSALQSSWVFFCSADVGLVPQSEQVGDECHQNGDQSQDGEPHHNGDDAELLGPL